MRPVLLSGADAIATDDQKAGLSVPEIVRETSIEILMGDEFLTKTVVDHRDQAANAVLNLYRRRRNPLAESPVALLDHLRLSAGLVEVYDLLAQDLTE